MLKKLKNECNSKQLWVVILIHLIHKQFIKCPHWAKLLREHLFSTTFFVNILSTSNSVVCEFGYYGLNCNQECSMFCKESRDCHPMSGYCKEGCKNGWQGLDCLEGVYFLKFILFIKVKEARYTETVCLYQTGIKQGKKYICLICTWYAYAYNSNI